MPCTIYKNGTEIKTCDVLKRGKCGRKAKWGIFGGDGKPYLSRLRNFSCSFHLARAVKECIESDYEVSVLNEEEDTFTKEEFEIK